MRWSAGACADRACAAPASPAARRRGRRQYGKTGSGMLYDRRGASRRFTARVARGRRFHRRRGGGDCGRLHGAARDLGRAHARTRARDCDRAFSACGAARRRTWRRMATPPRRVIAVERLWLLIRRRLRAHLARVLHTRLQLRLLLRCEHLEYLVAQRLAILRRYGAATRMRLAELLHQRADLSVLRLREVKTTQHAHRAAVVMADGWRRRRRALRERRGGQGERSGECRDDSQRMKTIHALTITGRTREIPESAVRA